MRSGEKDGTGVANPVGVAGLMAMTVAIIGNPGSSVGGGNPGTPTLPLSSKANDAFASMPVYAIPEKAPPMDTPSSPLSFPKAKMIELTFPETLQNFTGAPARYTVTNTSGAPAAAVIEVTVRFLDLSVSATDPDE